MEFAGNLKGKKRPDSKDELANTLGGMRDPGYTDCPKVPGTRFREPRLHQQATQLGVGLPGCCLIGR